MHTELAKCSNSTSKGIQPKGLSFKRNMVNLLLCYVTWTRVQVSGMGMYLVVGFGKLSFSRHVDTNKKCIIFGYGCARWCLVKEFDNTCSYIVFLEQNFIIISIYMNMQASNEIKQFFSLSSAANLFLLFLIFSLLPYLYSSLSVMWPLDTDALQPCPVSGVRTGTSPI